VSTIDQDLEKNKGARQFQEQKIGKTGKLKKSLMNLVMEIVISFQSFPDWADRCFRL